MGPDPINDIPKIEQPQLPIKPVFKKESNLHPLIKITSVILIIFLLIGSFVLVEDFLSKNNVQDVVKQKEIKTINVSANASVYNISNFAVVNVSLETSGSSLSEAVAQNVSKLDAVISSVGVGGILADNINQVEYLVVPKYQKQSTGKVGVVSYEVKQIIQVKMPIDLVDATLQNLLNSGADTISDLSFVSSEEEALVLEAKAAAILKAENEAQAISEKLGWSLGELVTYSDSSLTELENGLITANVNLTYTINEN